MRKLSNVIGFITTAVAIILLANGMAGCKALDLNGDGKFDPVAYLQDADISVGWVDQDTGEIYTMALDELGHKILGEWVRAKTGFTYQLDPKGGISIVDSKGQAFTVSIKDSKDE